MCTRFPARVVFWDYFFVFSRYPFLPEKRTVTVISVAMPNLNERVNKCPVYSGPSDLSALRMR